MHLSDLLQIQYAQQETLEGPLPVGTADRRALATQYAHYAGEELYSYLRAAGYKHFTDALPAPRSTRVEEIVDALKFLLCIAWTEEITPEELEAAFRAKTMVVEEQRKKMDATNLVAGFDIDGVLAQYSVWGENWENQEPFIESGKVLELPMAHGADHVPAVFKMRGYGVVMVTARKTWVHRRLESDTYRWLAKHNIPYDRVLFGHDKMELIKQHGFTLRFFVEDNPKHALDVASGGVKTYYLGTPVFGPVEHPNIITIDSLWEILEREEI